MIEEQAKSLVLEKERYRPDGFSRVISFTSGKGGVGKTHSVINTAVSLAEMGRRVLIFDADLSLANVDVLLGLEIHKTVEDFLLGNVTLQDCIVEDRSGVSILPASSGAEWMSNLHSGQRQLLLTELEQLASEYDYLFIDTPAGANDDVLFFNACAQETILIINREPSSLTDAYALAKLLCKKYGNNQLSVLVNSARNAQSAERTYLAFAEALEQYLQISTSYRGWVPHDELVASAALRRRSLASEFPSSPASRQFRELASRIDNDFHSVKMKGGVQLFFRQLLELRK